MRIFDPHIHMTSRTTDDYERMAAAGVRALVEPAFWLGQPRTSAGSFTDYFDSLTGWEPFRASQFGIRHYCALALNPKEANDPRCREVLGALPRYLARDGVVAVGEIGYDSMTPAEDEVFAAQLALAVVHDLPVLVHTPHRDKQRGTRRTGPGVRTRQGAQHRPLLRRAALPVQGGDQPGQCRPAQRQRGQQQHPGRVVDAPAREFRAGPGEWAPAAAPAHGGEPHGDRVRVLRHLPAGVTQPLRVGDLVLQHVGQ